MSRTEHSQQVANMPQRNSLRNRESEKMLRQHGELTQPPDSMEPNTQRLGMERSSQPTHARTAAPATQAHAPQHGTSSGREAELTDLALGGGKKRSHMRIRGHPRHLPSFLAECPFLVRGPKINLPSYVRKTSAGLIINFSGHGPLGQ